MEILWCTKAPRADIYSQFVSALRTAAGCVKRRSRRAGPMCPAAKYALLPAGHAGPALQGAAVAWGGQGRSPLHVLCGTSYPKGICSAALHCRTPSPTLGLPHLSVGRDPCVLPQNTAFVPAGHTGPALQGGSTDSRRKKRKPLRAFFFCI